MTTSNTRPGLPSLWNARRSTICAWLIVVGIIQTLGTIALSISSAALLRSENIVHGVPVPMAITGSALIALGFFIVQNRAAERFALSYVHDVRMAYAKQIMLLPFDGKAPGVGLSLTRMVNDLGAIKLWLSKGLLALITLIPTLATVAVWIMTAVTAFMLPLIACLAVWSIGIVVSMPRLRASIRQSRQKRGGIAILLGRTLPQRLPLLMHGKLTPVLSRLARKSDEVCRLLTIRATWSAVMRAASRATFPFAVGIFALSGGVETGAIALFLLIFAFLSAQLEAGAAGLEYYQANKVAREKLKSVFNLPAMTPVEVKPAPALDWQRSIEIANMELPSGNIFSTVIEPKQCNWIFQDDPHDLSHIVLSLSGLTQSHAQDRIKLGDVSFARIGRKTLWRNIALVSPANGIPAYQRRRPAFLLGADKRLPTEKQSRLSGQLGLDTDWIPEAAPNLSETELVRIRISRALFRQPKILLVHDDHLLANHELTAILKDLADKHMTTLVFLTRAAESIPLAEAASLQ